MWTPKSLNVTKSDIKKEYNKMSDEELSEVIHRQVLAAKLEHSVSFQFFILITSVPFTRKQSLLFLNKMNTSSKMIAYLYRHLIRCAHFYGVPKVIIRDYLREKEMYYMYKDGTYTKSSIKEEHRLKLRKNVYTLLLSTIEMIQRSNTRKSKLERITDKISDNIG